MEGFGRENEGNSVALELRLQFVYHSGDKDALIQFRTQNLSKTIHPNLIYPPSHVPNEHSFLTEKDEEQPPETP